jgi:hypothetical protein
MDSRFSSVGFAALVATIGALALWSPPAWAQTQSYDYEVLLDVDRDGATGCTVTPSGGMAQSGFEYRLVATVEVGSSSASVTGVQVAECGGGGFGVPTAVTPPVPPWPVALDAGVGGADAIEVALPRSAVTTAPEGTLEIAFVADSGSASDVLATVDGSAGGAPIVVGFALPAPIPALTLWGAVILLVAIAGLAWLAHRRFGRIGVAMAVMLVATAAWAANFAADGDLSDWTGTPPAGQDPTGDASAALPAVDLIAGFAAFANGSFFFRFDVVDVESQPPTAVDDAFDATLGTVDGDAVAPGVLGNDTLGVPEATLVDYGAAGVRGTLPGDPYVLPGSGGVTITVDADGALTIDASAGTAVVGVYTFEYRIENAVGTDTAAVTVEINQAPTARADVFTFAFDADQSAPNSLLADNGAGADALGTPAGDIVSFGGGDLGGGVGDNAAGTGVAFAGGTLTVNADGSWSLTGQPFDPGQYAFDYALENSAGSDTATVALNIQSPPAAVADSYNATVGEATNVALANGVRNANDAWTLTSTPAVFPDATVSAFGDVGSPAVAPGNPYTLPSSGGVTVTLAADGSFVIDATASTAQPGSYPFDYALSNGTTDDSATVTIDVREAPAPRPDVYSFPASAGQIVTAGSGLFADNGSGADALGTPSGTIDFFGGGDLGGAVGDNPAGSSAALAGGTLTVNADGSWSLTGQPFDPGQYAFDYRVTNAVGNGTATVTLNVQAPPTAVDDDPSGAIAYDVTLGTSQTFVVAGGVRNRNDDWTLPNVFPDATVARYAAPGDLGGASEVAVGGVYSDAGIDVTIQADGEITVDATGASSQAVIQLEYELTNTAGADTAIVTIRANAPPTVTQSRVEVNDPADTLILLPEQGTAPAPTATDFADLAFGFSEAVTFNPGAFSVICTTSGNVTGALTASATPATTVTLTYGGPGLASGETCTVTLVSDNILDAQGNRLDGNGDTIEDGSPADDEVYDFVVDTPPSLTLVEVEVADVYTTVPGTFAGPGGVTDTDTDTMIRLTFDEPINENSAVAVTCDSETLNTPTGSGLTSAGSGTNQLVLTRASGTFTAGDTCAISFTTSLITDVDSADTPDDLTTPSPLTYEFEIAPVANNDAFAATSHLEARFDAVAPGTTNLLTNDLPVGATVAEVEGTAVVSPNTTVTLTSGAMLTVETDGDFNYVPPPGAGNGATDTFTYTLNAPNGSSATATVTMTIDGPVIWYVDADAPGPIYNGTAAFPFDNLAVSSNGFDGSAGDIPGARVFVYDSASDNSAVQCGLTLLDNQFVFGEGEPAGSFLTITGLTPVVETVNPPPDTTGNHPQLSSTGDCFTLGAGNTVRGLDVNNTTGGAAFVDGGATVGTATINNVSVRGAGSIVEFLNGGTLAGQFNETSSTGSPSTKIHLVNIDGTMDSVGGTLNHAAAGTDMMIVSGGNIGGSMNASFNQTGGNALLNISGGHTGTWFFNQTMTANTGSGMQFNNADGIYNINNAVTISGTTAGVNIENGSNGEVRLNSGASDISAVQGIPFRVNSSTATVAYDGDIFHRAPADISQRMIELINATGPMSFNGTYAAGDNGNPPASFHAAEGLYMEATGAVNTVTVNYIDLTSGSTSALKGLTSGNLTINRARVRCDGDLTIGADTHCIEFSDVISAGPGVTIEAFSVDTDDAVDNGGAISLVNTPGTWTVEEVFGVFTRLQPAVFGNNFGTLNISTVDSPTSPSPGGVVPGPIVSSEQALFDLTNGTVNVDMTLMNAFNVPDHAVNLVNVDGPLFRNTGASSISGVAGSNALIFMDSVSTSDVFFSTDGTTANAVTLDQRRATALYANNVTSSDVQFGTVNVDNPNSVPEAPIRIQNSSAPFTFASTNIDQGETGGTNEYSGAPIVPTDTGGVGDAISVNNLDNTLTINGGTIFNVSDDAIDARDLLNLSVNNLTVNHTVNDLEGATGIQVYNSTLSGDSTYALNNVTLQEYSRTTIGGEQSDGLRLQHYPGTASTLTLTVDNSTFIGNPNTSVIGYGNGISVDVDNGGSAFVFVGNSQFTNNANGGVEVRHAAVGNEVIAHVTTNNFNRTVTVAGGSDVALLDPTTTSGSTFGFAIEDNVMTGPGYPGGTGINVALGRTDAGENSVNHAGAGLPLPYNSIRGNQISNITTGIGLSYQGSLDVEVSSNTMEDMNSNSLVIQPDSVNTTTDNEIVVTDNVIGTAANPAGTLFLNMNGSGGHLYLFDNNQIYNGSPAGNDDAFVVLTADTLTADITISRTTAETTKSRGLDVINGLISGSSPTICLDIGISTAGTNTFTGPNNSRTANIAGTLNLEDQANVPAVNSFTPGWGPAGTTSVASGTCTEPVLN